jgi:hypothetical protein
MGDRILRHVLLSACLASLCACSDDSSGSDASATSGAGAASAGAGAQAGAAGADAKEQCLPDYQQFAVGPSSPLFSDPKSGIAVKVLDGPVPPEFGYNTWTIQLVDAATMAPAPNARITWQCAFMEVHGHGSNPKSIEDLGDGKYKLVDMNMRMVGPWQIKFWIDATGQQPQYMPTSSNILNGMACNPSTGVQGVESVLIKACVPS